MRDKRVVLIREGSFREVDWIDANTIIATRLGRGGEQDALEILDVTAAVASLR
jgi:hypothetical protein